MDFKLPTNDGIILEELKSYEYVKNIPVIMITI